MELVRLTIVSGSEKQGSHFRRFVAGVFVSAILAAVLTVGFRHHGKSAWEKYKSDMEARGENLDWRSVRPPPLPPDDENFATAPLLKALGVRGQNDATAPGRLTALPIYSEMGYTGDLEKRERTDLGAIQTRLRGRTNASFSPPPLPQDPAADVLLAMKPMESELNELREAAVRPYAQIKLEFPDPISAQRPDFVALRELSQLFNMRAIAGLRLGRVEEAFADNRVVLRLADASFSSPDTVCAMIYCAINGLATQPFWEGWLANRWSDQQLHEFQRLFGRVNLLAAYDTGLRGTRALVNFSLDSQSYTNASVARGGDLKSRLLEYAFRIGGIEQASQLTCNRFLDEFAFSNYGVREQQVYPKKLQENSTRLKRAVSRWRPSTYLAGIAVPNTTRALEAVARNQTYVNLSLVVCGLELHRRAHGQYPESFNSLVSEFAQKLPHDLVTGQPLKYRRTDDGKFLLYSVGWNEKDDGGVSDKNKDKGDWVWPVRAKN